MTLVVTAAGGHFGRLAVEDLLARDVAADQIVAGARDPQKIADLAAKGVRTVALDYNDPASLAAAFEGATRVLFVSGTEFGQRVGQGENVAEAARNAGVELLAYTSAPYADTTPMKLAGEHRGTEEAIKASGVPYAFLRNSWYFENYLGNSAPALEHGAVIGAAGEGRVSGALRGEYASAGAAVLAGGDHVGQVYELGGDESFTLPEYAALLAEYSGKPVVYQELSEADLNAALQQAGLPAPVADIMADVDTNIAAGRLEVTSGDLSRLIGRPTTPLRDAVKAHFA